MGIDDKRQLTADFVGSLAADFLPPQLVYKGKSPHCLPTTEFPPDWNITFSANHWSNEDTMRDYVLKIIFPYIVKKEKK